MQIGSMRVDSPTSSVSSKISFAQRWAPRSESLPSDTALEPKNGSDHTRVPSRLPMVPLQTVQLLATTATNEQQQHNSWGAHRAQKVIFKATLSEGKFHGPGQGKPWCNFLARPLPPKSLCPLNIETHGQHAPMWLAMVA